MRPPSTGDNASGAPSTNNERNDDNNRGGRPAVNQNLSPATTSPANIDRGQQTAQRLSWASIPDMYALVSTRPPGNGPRDFNPDRVYLGATVGATADFQYTVDSRGFINAAYPTRRPQPAAAQTPFQPQRGRDHGPATIDPRPVPRDRVTERTFERYPELAGASLDSPEVRRLIWRIRSTEAFLFMWLSSQQPSNGA